MFGVALIGAHNKYLLFRPRDWMVWISLIHMCLIIGPKSDRCLALSLPPSVSPCFCWNLIGVTLAFEYSRNHSKSHATYPCLTAAKIITAINNDNNKSQDNKNWNRINNNINNHNNNRGHIDERNHKSNNITNSNNNMGKNNTATAITKAVTATTDAKAPITMTTKKDNIDTNKSHKNNKKLLHQY